MDTGRRDFAIDWVSKDVAKYHRTTAYIHTHIKSDTGELDKKSEPFI
jgi:hypothetical protein